MNRLLVCLGLLFSQVGLGQTDLTIHQVTPGIYLHQSSQHWPNKSNHGEIANIGFIVGNKCVAVIDTGGSPEQGLALFNSIKQTTKTPICYVINTHVHPDHIYGNRAFKQTGINFVGHHKLARAMEARAPFYLSRAKELLDINVNQNNIIPPDLAVKDTMTLDLGDREIVLTAHRTAHTDNDLSVYDRKTDTLWLSDLLFLEHIPVIDGSIKGWLEELNRLEKNHYTLVIPGHGSPSSNWPAAMHAEKSYLNDLANEIRIMIKQGKTLEQAVDKVGLSAKSHWLLADEFHRKNITTAFAELEWED